MKSDTPETDAEVNEYKDCPSYNMVHVDFVRKLERERNELKEALNKIVNVIYDGDDAYDDLDAISAIAHAELNK